MPRSGRGKQGIPLQRRVMRKGGVALRREVRCEKRHPYQRLSHIVPACGTNSRSGGPRERSRNHPTTLRADGRPEPSQNRCFQRAIDQERACRTLPLPRVKPGGGRAAARLRRDRFLGASRPIVDTVGSPSAEIVSNLQAVSQTQSIVAFWPDKVAQSAPPSYIHIMVYSVHICSQCERRAGRSTGG
jgi:hypothetical protein